jgi:ribosomal protein L37AE/L43A
MEPHDCPDCGVLYRPRHEREAERCWSCAGMTISQHVAAMHGTTEPAIAHKHGARPVPTLAPGSDDYLAQIEALLKT